ncbi:MAG: lipoprotein insertase outer membrane protein LolB [Gammaproteobacteria bacterium]|nr:lipoprotein insertase outer membrane protein LolB [Gammaproteobacteria bacterium]
MTRHISVCLAVTIAYFMLVSCAMLEQQVIQEEPAVESKRKITEPAGWAAEQHKRQQISIWEIRGRLGVQTASNGGSMDIIWKESNEEFSIRLIAPMGAGSHLIQGNDQFAEILFPDGQRKVVNNVDDVLATVLDVDLPVSAIKDWVRGLPARSLPIEKISWNKQGLLDRVKQAGWNVEMNKYLGNTILMPHAIYVNRDNDDELDVRLALRQWLIDN